MVIIRAARLLAWDQASHCGKKEKKSALAKKKLASKTGREVDWGGERVTDPVFCYFSPLRSLIRPRLLAYENWLSCATSRALNSRPLTNLVPRAFPSKNGRGGKRPWHRLVTCTA